MVKTARTHQLTLPFQNLGVQYATSSVAAESASDWLTRGTAEKLQSLEEPGWLRLTASWYATLDYTRDYRMALSLFQH